MDPIELMRHHTSVRNFKAQKLSLETKQQLLTAARAASSSNFVQATSIIEITDSQILNELAEISQSAAYVKKSGVFYVFIADLYRQAHLLEAHHQNLAPLQNMESLLVSVVDTAIAAENMAVAAESLGLGVCYIGGIRNDLNRVSELLKLPKYTIPLFGLTIGIPETKNKVKPRLPLRNFSAQNTYSVADFTDLTDYDQTMHEYYHNRSSHAKDTNWTKSQLEFFSIIRRPEVADFIAKQGFKIK